MLSGLRHMKERAEAIAAERKSPVEIGAIPALAGSVVPAALGRFAKDGLPEQVHLRSMPAEGVLQSVVARSADIGLSGFPIDHTGVEIVAVFEAPCVVALPADDPLAGRHIIALADFRNRPLVAMANPYRQRRRVDLLCERNGIDHGRIIDTNASINALQLVRSGLGMAVIEPVAALGTPWPPPVAVPGQAGRSPRRSVLRSHSRTPHDRRRRRARHSRRGGVRGGRDARGRSGVRIVAAK